MHFYNLANGNYYTNSLIYTLCTTYFVKVLYMIKLQKTK